MRNDAWWERAAGRLDPPRVAGARMCPVQVEIGGVNRHELTR